MGSRANRIAGGCLAIVNRPFLSGSTSAAGGSRRRACAGSSPSVAVSFGRRASTGCPGSAAIVEVDQIAITSVNDVQRVIGRLPAVLEFVVKRTPDEPRFQLWLVNDEPLVGWHISLGNGSFPIRQHHLHVTRLRATQSDVANRFVDGTETLSNADFVVS